MVKAIVNFFGKITGAGKVLDYINGAKTYISGGALILSGAAQVLSQLAAVHDLAGLLDWAKHLPQDQGVLAFMAGLAAVGLRHAVAKQDAPAVSQ